MLLTPITTRIRALRTRVDDANLDALAAVAGLMNSIDASHDVWRILTRVRRPLCLLQRALVDLECGRFDERHWAHGLDVCGTGYSLEVVDVVDVDGDAAEYG